jgi:abhydrolase domain-containing protein 6
MDRLIDQGGSPLVAPDAAAFERMLALVFEQRPFLPRPILAVAEQRAVSQAASDLRLWHEQLKDRHLLDARVAGLRPPALVLWGAADRVFDASGAPVLGAKLPGAAVHVLPGIGHLPMMEAPRQAARRYADFLGALGR